MDSTPNATRRLTDFLAALSYSDLPPQAVVSAKRCLLEILSGAMAGYPTPYIRKFDEDMAEAAAPEATVIGSSRRRSAEQAALINGSAAVVKEFIGGHRFSFSMPVIAAIPAALACAEREKSDGKTLLLAIVTGVEAHARIGMATIPTKTNFHPHGTLAVFGAAGAVGKLAGFSADEMYTLFNIASVLPLFAHRRTTFEGGTVRNAYPGFSAANAVMAAKMVRAGIVGVEDGIATCYADTVAEGGLSTDVLLDEIGNRFEICRNYYKFHSCDRHLHGALEIVADMLQGPDGAAITPESVVGVTVRTYDRAARCNSKTPRNAIASQWSIPHGIGAMLVLGSSGTEAFSEQAAADPCIRAAAQLVDVFEDPAFSAQAPNRRPTSVSITLRDGRTLSGEKPIASGEFDSGEADPELERKLVAKCRALFLLGGMPEEKADQAIAMTSGLETLSNLSGLTSLLRGPF